jgi:hypothetical protein
MTSLGSKETTPIKDFEVENLPKLSEKYFKLGLWFLNFSISRGVFLTKHREG